MFSYTTFDYMAMLAIMVYLSISFWILFYRSLAFGGFLVLGTVYRITLIACMKYTPVDSLDICLVLPICAGIIYIVYYIHDKLYSLLKIFVSWLFNRFRTLSYSDRIIEQMYEDEEAKKTELMMRVVNYGLIDNFYGIFNKSLHPNAE